MNNSNQTNMSAARRRLARQIAAVLANPATPAALANAITDELTFYMELAGFESPRMVEMSLLAYEENRELADAAIDETETGDLIG